MYSFISRRRQRGFSLIEVVVVVAIIGLLTAVILTSVGEARKQSRDKQRKIDLKNLQLAVELYREANGVYPAECVNSTAGWVGSGNQSGTFACDTPSDDFIQNVTPTFIHELPYEDNAQLTNAAYIYNTNGIDYKIMAFRTVESSLITDNSDEFARCPDTCTNVQCDLINTSFPITYAVYSSGASCW